MALKDVQLPELGEGVDSGDVVAVLVSPGDSVQKDQPLIEVECEKASVEIPCPFEGIVCEVKVKVGDQVKIGQTIITLETGKVQTEEETPSEADKENDDKTAVSDLDGERQPEPPSRTREAAGAPPQRTGDQGADGEGRREFSRARDRERTRGGSSPGRPLGLQAASDADHAGESDNVIKLRPGELIPAGPAVRRLARELGINLRDVPGSGPAGRISIEDVKGHARGIISRAGPATASPKEPSSAAEEMRPEVDPELPDFTQWGEVEREPLSSLRRKATEATSTSWRVIPHVTQFDHADITELERQRRHLSSKMKEAGGKLTVTAIIIKVTATALRRFPRFNASLDVPNAEVIYKKYVNIGVAVDTDRGLMVPVLQAADKKSLQGIAMELRELADLARNRKLPVDKMRGSNFSVTNLGGLGTTYFTPIVIWPDVAVLGIGRSETRPIHIEGRFEPRQILPLCVSYDHRLIDGADAARFLRWIAEGLENPLALMLEGDDPS